MKYKTKNKILLLAALSSVFFFLFASEAQAFAPALAAAAIFALVPLVIGLIKGVAAIGTFILVVNGVSYISGKLLDWGISFQNNLLDPAIITPIQTTWGILRDFINVFFILILLIIAFATIFNVSKYRARDLLPKLIIAALLINFSLIITIEAIKLLWVPAAVFLKPLGEEVSGRIVNTLNIQSFFNPGFIKYIPAGVGTSVEFIEQLFRGVLLVIDAFLLSWMALIIWARIPVLIGLMIVSPIAWLGLALPAITKNTWDAWWRKLFCWGSIPIPLFGLIYFVILFNQKLKTEIVGAIPGSVLDSALSYLGFNADQAIVWAITAGVFLAGMIYIRDLSCSMYSWMAAGFGGLWKGIRRGVGATVDFGYAATGYKGAIGKIGERMTREGYPVPGLGPRFGTAAREARETRREDQLAGWVGLPPKYKVQTETVEKAGKAEKDIENKLKQAGSLVEEREIIKKLRATTEEETRKGTKDPETLAAINVLAKRGQLDMELFNQAVNKFKDMPLALTEVLSKWKEGKFGGISIEQFLQIMRDEKKVLPLETRRVMYNFAASDDGKKITEKMGAYKDDKGNDITDYKIGYELLGRKATRDGREFTKKVGGLRPDLKAEYVFNLKSGDPEYKDRTDLDEQLEKSFERKAQSIADAMFANIRGASVKDLSEINSKIWQQENFQKALAMMIEEKTKLSPQAAASFKRSLERNLINGGKADQLRVFHSVATVGGETGKGKIILTPGARFELEKERREAREAEEEEEEEKT